MLFGFDYCGLQYEFSIGVLGFKSFINGFGFVIGFGFRAGFSVRCGSGFGFLMRFEI